MVNGEVSQTSAVAAPASTVGPSVTVNTFVSVIVGQLPFPSTVKVRVTVAFAAINAGVYVGPMIVASSSAPVPSSLHEITPLVDAASLIVNGAVSQTSAVAAPAST